MCVSHEVNFAFYSSLSSPLPSGVVGVLRSTLALPALMTFDDCSLSATAGYEVELDIGKEVLELTAWLPKNLYVGDVLSGELVGILSALG